MVNSTERASMSKCSLMTRSEENLLVLVQSGMVSFSIGPTNHPSGILVRNPFCNTSTEVSNFSTEIAESLHHVHN
jgi:hypothetical protein